MAQFIIWNAYRIRILIYLDEIGKWRALHRRRQEGSLCFYCYLKCIIVLHRLYP